MAEFLYATSHLAGDFTSPDNALGNTPGTWAGQLNTNVTQTSRWAIGDPVDPLTAAATQIIDVVARKGSNSGTPTIALNLYENGVLVGEILAATSVTSTTGQTLTGTFNSSAITDRTLVEVEVVMTAAGGSPSARNSAQISHIEWEADTSPAAPSASGGSTSTVTVATSGDGAKAGVGGAVSVVSIPASGDGTKAAASGSGAIVTVTTTGGGSGGAESFSGGSQATVTATSSGGGSKSVDGGSEAQVTITDAGAGTTGRFDGAVSNIVVDSSGVGSSARFGGSESGVLVVPSGGGSNPAGPISGGSTASVSVSNSGVGSKASLDGAVGLVVVSVAGAGSKAASGGSAAILLISATGGSGGGPTGIRLMSKPAVIDTHPRAKAIERRRIVVSDL